jgi:Putative peptidoglycan binding domain/LysM domain
MPDHVVIQGDCLSSIAKQYGLLKQTIWSHARNASLRQQRPNPDTLFPGDIVFIPPLHESEFDRPVDQMHKFVLNCDRIRFPLRLLLNDEPRADEPYVLQIRSRKLSGKTDKDGWIDQSIPADAEEGLLSLQEDKEKYVVEFGHIDPIDKVTGVQGRLRNLGYFDGEIDGQLDAETAGAVAAFQAKHKLNPTGEIDTATRSLLQQDYGH